MRTHTAVMATTHRLDDGWQFTRADLEQLAATFDLSGPQATLNIDHRLDKGSAGRILRVWVEPMNDTPQNAGHYALRALIEIPDDVSDEVIEGIAARGFMSISFFTGGIRTAGSVGDPDLIIGISPELAPDFEAAFATIQLMAPSSTVAVCESREHNKEVVLQWVVVVGKWLVEQLGTNIFTLLFTLAVASRDRKKPLSQLAPDTMKINANTAHGAVHAFVPLDADEAAIEVAMREVAKVVVAHQRGQMGDGRVGLSFDRHGHAVKLEDDGRGV